MAAKRTPLMAGNWKMNLNHQEAVVLVQKLAWTLSDKRHDFGRVEVVVLPPFTDLRSVQTLVDGDRLRIKYGAQDVSTEDGGAFTGDISAAMLAKLGCSYVVVGHSERRECFGETDEALSRKVPAALAGGVLPILCCGETEEARDADETDRVLRRQIEAGLSRVPEERLGDVVVAYEPIWAIGTGRTATPDQAQEACAFIRDVLRGRGGPADEVRILYGGSVKPANAAVAAVMNTGRTTGGIDNRCSPIRPPFDDVSGTRSTAIAAIAISTTCRTNGSCSGCGTYWTRIPATIGPRLRPPMLAIVATTAANSRRVSTPPIAGTPQLSSQSSQPPSASAASSPFFASRMITARACTRSDSIAAAATP